MSTASQRRGFQGVTKLRRKLRKMDDEMTRGIKVEIAAAANTIERDMVGMVPVDEGDLARSISKKIGRDGFTAVIGPVADSVQIKKGFGVTQSKYTKTGNLTAASIRNNRDRFILYRANWIEFGTKKGDAGSSAKEAQPFIQPAYDINKDALTRRVKAAVAETLRMASDG